MLLQERKMTKNHLYYLYACYYIKGVRAKIFNIDNYIKLLLQLIGNELLVSEMQK